MIPFKKGTFDGLMDYLVTGRTLNAIHAALRQRTPVAGPGITLKEVDGGYVISSSSTAEGDGNAGAFWGTYAGLLGTYLQGGTVTAGNIVTVEDFLMLRPNGDPCEDGDLLWLQISGEANITDGALTGGVSISGTSMYVGNAVLEYPTAASPGFNFTMEIGRWTPVGFSPAIRGNRGLSFYPGAGFRVGVG